MSNDGIVKIGKNNYKTVALRVSEFREKFPIESGWGIHTEVVSVNDSVVLMKASIVCPEGRVVAVGYAEEFRTERGINSTSALEVCETSAIGRALAASGLAGTEYASADEVANAIAQQNQRRQQQSRQQQSRQDAPPWDGRQPRGDEETPRRHKRNQ